MAVLSAPFTDTTRPAAPAAGRAAAGAVTPSGDGRARATAFPGAIVGDANASAAPATVPTTSQPASTGPPRRRFLGARPRSPEDPSLRGGSHPLRARGPRDSEP